MSKLRMTIFGCGYVGRSLAERASREGHEVWIHSRNIDALNRVQGIPVERKIVANLQSADWHDRLAGDWDVVVNLVSSAGGGLEGYRLSYLEGNRSIREWAAGREVERFVYTSATSVYPQSDGQWVTEEDVPELDELSTSGQVLRQAELEALAESIIPTRIIMRLGGIYGPGRHLYLDRLREGADSLPGEGSSWLNLIYLRDIVDVLMRLTLHPLPVGGHIFNVVDNKPARKQEIVDWLASELGLNQIPFDPTRTSGRSRRRKAGGALPNRRISNERIRRTLDWEPRFPDFRSGYRDIMSLG